jgi:predicted O-methyltransferase YrrM
MYLKNKFSANWYLNNVYYWSYFFTKIYDTQKIKNVLEIGSYEGASSVFFLNLSQDCNIYCVDTWSEKFTAGVSRQNINYKKVERTFDLNLKNYRTRLRKCKNNSDFFFKNIKKKLLFDIIYIDGSHDYKDVLNDAYNSFNYLRSGGVMIFDDLLKSETLKAILNFVKKKENHIYILMVYHQIILQKKIY